MTTITFTAYDTTFTAIPEFGRYANGRLAISMLDPEDGSPVCTLTTNLPDQHLNEGEVFIKDWAENAPIVEALLKEGWLQVTGREGELGVRLSRGHAPRRPPARGLQPVPLIPTGPRSGGALWRLRRFGGGRYASIPLCPTEPQTGAQRADLFGIPP